MSKRNIHINIDSLVVQGANSVHGESVAEAVRSELARLIAEGGVPPQWARGTAAVPREVPREVPQLDAASAQTPAHIGAHVARAIYRGGKS